jgi:hypothetical protein
MMLRKINLIAVLLLWSTRSAGQMPELKIDGKAYAGIRLERAATR